MRTLKIVAIIFVFNFSALYFFYLSFHFSWNKTPIILGEKENQFMKNSLVKENRSLFSPHNRKESEKSSFDFVKFLSNWMKNKTAEIFFDEISIPNERSFEDKCLASFNRSYEKNDSEKYQNFEFLKTKEGKEYKIILGYCNGKRRNFEFGFGYELFEAACCKEKRCFLTQNRSLKPIEEFDAILFRFRGLTKIPLPKRRNPHQRWILYEIQPPPYTHVEPQNFEGVFNWTMTYRRDSDVIVSYGDVYKKEDFEIEDFSKFESFSYSLGYVMKTKNKMVSWIVSDCNPPSKREEYVKELQKFIPVDIYGKCGPLKCGNKQQDARCYKKMEKEYKFYLSFENNLCKDYVTEKFYKMLNYHIIPVVLGSGDYAAVAPPHSYINVKDFKTPEDLANYLIYLDKNDTAYVEYFNWKTDYFVMSGFSWFHHTTSFCTLCQKLHSDKTEKVYYNLTEWFLGEAQCNKDLNKLTIPSSS